MSNFIQWQNVYIVPILHYTMESACYVKQAFDEIQPDCVAVELVESLEQDLKAAAMRLPDISVVVSGDDQPLYYLVEPCDACFEGLRLALENNLASYCIDLDLDQAPTMGLPVPDPYAMARIGLFNYYQSYEIFVKQLKLDHVNLKREEHMAKRLKELSLRHEKILCIVGMDHVHRLVEFLQKNHYQTFQSIERVNVNVCALTEESCRQVMAESAYITVYYEIWRSKIRTHLIDRHKINYLLLKEAAVNYTTATSFLVQHYHVRNTMKFARNWAYLSNQLLPNLYQLITSAKGCVDHNYAYEVWLLATTYMYRKNIDGLLELNLTAQEVWGKANRINFRPKQLNPKQSNYKKRPNPKGLRFRPLNPYSICSYPKEDVRIEAFAQHIKKRGETFIQDEQARVLPFSTSLEDGIDFKETIRHWAEKKLYVIKKGKPQGSAGSVVIIFDEDQPSFEKIEKFPWKLTWQGENSQESDMSFYATDRFKHIVGPGIGRCEYGGMMMSFPPGRMFDVWSDPDYENCRSKAEVLLMAAIDYAIDPLVVYVAASPPRSYYKSYANRFGKKIVYLPLSQFSSVLLNQLRVFHVLDGHDRRAIADDFIS